MLSSAGLKKTSRRTDLDVLNVIMTWTILHYHTVLFYTPMVSPYKDILDAPKNPRPDDASFYTVASGLFVNSWAMNFFFFIAGVSSYLALNRYTIVY